MTHYLIYHFNKLISKLRYLRTTKVKQFSDEDEEFDFHRQHNNGIKIATACHRLFINAICKTASKFHKVSHVEEQFFLMKIKVFGDVPLDHTLGRLAH